MTIWTALFFFSIGIPTDFLSNDNKDFNLRYEVSGGHPLPPDDGGATCEEHHTLELNLSRVEIKSFCGAGSIGNEGRVLYSKTLPMTVPLFLNIISKVTLSEITSLHVFESLEKQVSDDQRVYLSVVNGLEKRTMSALRKNSIHTDSVGVLLDTLDKLFDSIFYM